MTDPLSPATLSGLLKPVLPKEATLSNPTSVLAALVHTIHVSLGFRLVKPAPKANANGEAPDPGEVNRLPASWFERNAEEESFAISYRHEQSSLLFEIRVHKLGNRVVVNAVAVEDNKTATLDVVTSDYLSNSSLPKKLSSQSSAGEEEGSPPSSTDILASTFNSPNRLTDFITLYKIQIIQKLIPGLVKPGYTEESDSGSGGPPPSTSSSSTQQPRPHVPDHSEREGIGAAPRFPPPGQGNPFEIGRSDLDPLGGAMGRLPRAGGDGMVVGPGHPLFNREREQHDPLRIPGTGGNGGQRGPWGGDGYLPPLGAPPGARFDPVAPFGPGGVPGVGQPPRRDWGDEMPPPGFDNEGGGNARFNPLNPGGQGGGGGFGGGFGGLGGPPRGGGAGGGFGNMFM